MESEDRFRKEHGIREDVWRERPHIPYELDEVSAVMVPETHFEELLPATKATIEDWVGRASGIAMARHPVPLSYKLPDIAAELRPDWSIWAKEPSWHDHDEFGPRTREFHEARRRTTRAAILKGGFRYGSVDVGDRLVHLSEVYGWGDDHFELDQGDRSRVEERHFHVHPAKYVFAPKPKIKKDELYEPHVHAKWWPEFEGKPSWWAALGAYTLPKGERRRIERAYYHLRAHEQQVLAPQPAWDEEHTHTLKVTYKDDTNPLTRLRLDMHPLAVPLLEEARDVYFVIEGCLKADAVLSTVLDTGEPSTVFSVPSVTLWQAEELEDFARERLQGKRVVIVPDSDWVENDAVRTQAFRLQEVLRGWGTDACVAAPTPEPKPCDLHGKWAEEVNEDRLRKIRTLVERGATEGERKAAKAALGRLTLSKWIPAPAGSKRGVDDFVADGVELGELVEIPRVPPTQEFMLDWMRTHLEKRGPWEEAAKKRDYPVLRWLTILAREDGTTQTTTRALAEYLGWTDKYPDPQSAQRQVNRALETLEDAGIISSDKPLDLHERRIRNLARKRRPDLHWKDSPTITILSDFRADRPHLLLRPL
jgi:hypothetical protein